MISSEKELEDYICNYQDDFIEKLQYLYGEYDIKFLGRQIRIGNDNIADLVYYYEEKKLEEIHYIIVELKFRELQPKDLSQLSRYMKLLSTKLKDLNHKNICVYGLFVSFGCDYDMQNIQMVLDSDDIKYLKIRSYLDFEEEDYIPRKEYISKLKLDDKIISIQTGEKDE